MSEEDRIRNLMMLDYSQLIMYAYSLEELNDINHKEIKRLNNIINELEKYINGRIEYCYNNGVYQDVFDVYNEFDMKLQELKGEKQ